MPALLDLQRAFRAALLADPGEAVAGSIVARGIAPLARLDIYRNNVTANLTGALKLSFPAVERLVGADFFAATVSRFLAAAPPRRANLYDWGDAFPGFLRSFPPAGSLPYLPDVARLEWAIGRALHALSVPPLGVQALADLTADQQASVCFRRHPSVSLLALAHPAHRIWQAVMSGDDEALSRIDPARRGEYLLVHSRADSPEVVQLSPFGFAFAGALCDGIPLCEALARIEADSAAGLLCEFLARGLFQSALPCPPGPPCHAPPEAEELLAP